MAMAMAMATTSAPTAFLSSRSPATLASRARHFGSFLSSSSPHPSLLPPPRRCRPFHRVLPIRPRASASTAAAPLEVCVKESLTSPGRLGDCPFSQRILLTLEEKQLLYDLKLINVKNKPEWFLTINPEGKVPALKLEEKWIADSDVIAQSLEEKYPEPPLSTPLEKALIGSKIFSSFIGFLTSKDPNDGKQEALATELLAFNNYIKENGPFINGSMISAADLSLGPKLYHMEVALGHYKKWSIPENLVHLKNYMKSIFTRDSFTKTRALKEDVIAGWRPKVFG